MHFTIINCCPPKITKLWNTHSHHYIFWLYIPMNNFLSVNIRHCIAYLINCVWSLVLRHVQPSNQRSMRRKLKKQKNMILIFKMRVQFDNIRMLKTIVNSEFIWKLFDHTVLSDSWLQYLLNSTNKSCSIVLTHVNIPKFSRSDAFPQSEISYMELLASLHLTLCLY